MGKSLDRRKLQWWKQLEFPGTFQLDKVYSCQVVPFHTDGDDTRDLLVNVANVRQRAERLRVSQGEGAGVLLRDHQRDVPDAFKQEGRCPHFLFPKWKMGDGKAVYVSWSPVTNIMSAYPISTSGDVVFMRGLWFFVRISML